MKSLDVTTQGTCRISSWGWAGNNNSFESRPYLTSQFSFTGFGKNDPKHKKRPTAGSYDKITHHRSDGTKRNSFRNYYTGELVGQRIESGHLGYDSIFRRNPGYSQALTYDNTTYNECLSKFYDKLRDSDLNLAVDLAEGGETYRMVKRAAVAAYNLVDEARRLKRRLKREPSKVAAEAWLTWKYGVSPTLQTIYECLEYSARRFDEIAIDAVRVRRQPFSDSLRDGAPYYVKYTLTGSRVYVCRMSGYVVPRDLTAFNLSRITSLNPAVIAWELVPLSFVIDWFFDVGSYLQNMEASLTSNVKIHDLFVTEVAVLEGKELAESGDVLQWVDSVKAYSTFNYTASYRRVIKKRTLPVGFPEPRLPSFEGKLGAQRILSVAALLRTILLGKV